MTKITNSTGRNKSGIYIIKNSINTRVYIGSAKDLYCRMIMHKTSLIKGTHYSSKMQRFVNKYGIETISFEIIEYTSKEYLLEKEQYWINHYQPEFNSCRIAGSRLGIKCNDESKERMRIAQTGHRVTSEEIRQHLRERKINIPLLQFDLDGNFVKEWHSTMEIKRQLGIDCSSVTKCVKGKILTLKGYFFIYKHSYNLFTVSERLKAIEVSYRPIIQMDLIGNTIKEWKYSALLIKEMGNSYYHCVANCCIKPKRNKTYCGYKWKYKFDKDGNINK
jgi:predicted GIY-YIG superfamily endonuclease